MRKYWLDNNLKDRVPDKMEVGRYQRLRNNFWKTTEDSVPDKMVGRQVGR